MAKRMFRNRKGEERKRGGGRKREREKERVGVKWVEEQSTFLKVKFIT